MSTISHKPLLIDILTKLIPHRSLASGVKALVESDYCTDTLVDGLLEIISKAIHAIKDTKAKKSLHHSLQKVKKMKAAEKIIQKQESDEADTLLTTLS